MSAETNNDQFRANVLAEIKNIIEELHELKNFKRQIVKKSTKRKPARRTVKKKTVKRKAAKRKPARRTVKKKTVKRKPARRR